MAREEREPHDPLVCQRKLPIGAEVVPNGVHFRVWGPVHEQITLCIGDEKNSNSPSLDMIAEGNGYFSLLVPKISAGTRYRFRLGGDTALYPDPASRFQPEGSHGPSMVVDASKFSWTDQQWPGLSLTGQIIYEMHIGTFTKQGTWAAAAAELPELAKLGVTVIEMMPVAEFPGRFGWGYDGVNLFAPTRLYGEPDDLRRFVDTAHAHGIGVILDVVYNHLGPDGNYLWAYTNHYFSKKYANEWGDAINFDGENSAPVREFFIANAKYWIEEFHFDGLRLDATQSMHDASVKHILADITESARAAARGRKIIIVAENEPQQTKLVQPVASGGYGIDGLWNDDFHHSAVVALTGRNEAYYSDYFGTPQEFISAAKWGYLYQGQWYSWQNQCRGTSARGIQPYRFITFIENHDQVANSGRGLRLHLLSSPSRYRAMVALLLLGPGTPMLFQGQEFGASSPFLYFADHHEELAAKVAEGRAQFLAQFPSLATSESQARLMHPADPATFVSSKLDFTEREKNAEIYTLYQDLLRLRREDATLRLQGTAGIDGAVLSNDALVLRFFTDEADDRLLMVNFGLDLSLKPMPEPLLAPPAGKGWAVLWSSEDPRYGGRGVLPIDGDDNWKLPGQAAVVLKPIARDGADNDRNSKKNAMELRKN